MAVPSRQHFSGANVQIAYTGTSYLDPKMQALVRTLDLGWMRFPAGTVDDVYDWRTGELRDDWITPFKGTHGVAYGDFQQDASLVRGKGGNTLQDFAALLASQQQGSSFTETIGVVNTFTDTPDSAADLVNAANTKHLHVSVWELGNEPFFFEKFYPSATAYLNAVKPFAQAVKRADPNAKVAVYLQRNEQWMTEMAHYPDRYWDELYWHAYPAPPPDTDQAGKIAFYNGFLAGTTDRFVEETLVPLFGPKMKLEVSEFNINALRGTRYAAVFMTEFLLRLAADPHVTQAGMHTLIGRRNTLDAAILPADDHTADVLAAFKAGKTIDTKDLDFGYYVSPYGRALELIDPVINGSRALWSTQVTGGSFVPAGEGPASTPAVYAQAFAMPGKDTTVLLTNKSAFSQGVSFTVNGQAVRARLSCTSMGGSDPTSKNTASQPDQVRLVHSEAAGIVTLQPYSVTAVTWNSQ